MTNDQKWRRLLRFLRKMFPCKVTVRRKILKGAKGETIYDKNKFKIFIDKRHDWFVIEDTLIHEWAHVLTWFGNDDNDHGDEWGLMFARIYRTVLAR